MTTTYNVNIVGSLTNNNGVLGNFSTSNYAKLPTNFNPSNNPWEIVFKFTTGNNFSSEVCIVSQTDTNWNGLKLDIDNGHLWFAVNFTDNTSGSITSNTILNINTTYYAKIIYNTTNYRMFISTDGMNFTLDETLASSKVISIPDDFTIGWMKCAPSRYFNGSIDLNGSYIKINNMLWWQGATSTSQAGIKIQLRHDTAANWTSVNPVLLEGEIGIETDTKKQKIGDGSTPWNGLQYDLGSTAARVLYVEYGVTTYNEIYNAYSTGTQISCAYNHLVYTLDNYRNNKFAFMAIDNSNSSQQYSNNSKIKIKCFTVSNNDTYSQITISDIVSTINTSNTKIITTDNATTTPLTIQTNVLDCWLGFSAHSGWLGSYGVDSTQSPVFYNGTLEHLATQEWIGTQGYLTSITSSNVTSALGYTPVNTNLSNLSTTGQKVIDGQPVAVNQLLTTSTAIGSYNIDISSYLPNDSYDYEIILNGEIYNSNSTYGQVWLSSSKSTAIIVSNAGTNRRLSEILTPLVVGTNREITMQITGHSIDWQNVSNRQGLYLVGYRRLGTNS